MKANSEQIRRYARSTATAAENIGELIQEQLDPALALSQLSISGQTADQITSLLLTLIDQTQRLTTMLCGVSTEMNAYAARLDRADEEAAKNITKQ